MTSAKTDKVSTEGGTATADERPLATESKSLDDAALDDVAGGINPQPLPPGKNKNQS